MFEQCNTNITSMFICFSFIYLETKKNTVETDNLFSSPVQQIVLKYLQLMFNN